ncbi:hypothetical protein [Alkalicoccus urumqiensis]|uniref:Uncharacterized protein n=1 Tax=Alkalicoccus urumqiensis TaxID=1548213 RepID=A0A2P6MLV7_ALKUR|nr:hypothetical protein [Alkalicoccus urumqiensis]PRO67287.1 hypothetical protein C6I21_01640 [Alkalicoccus urumqiensis]
MKIKALYRHNTTYRGLFIRGFFDRQPKLGFYWRFPDRGFFGKEKKCVESAGFCYAAPGFCWVPVRQGITAGGALLMDEGLEGSEVFLLLAEYFFGTGQSSGPIPAISGPILWKWWSAAGSFWSDSGGLVRQKPAAFRFPAVLVHRARFLVRKQSIVVRISALYIK